MKPHPSSIYLSLLAMIIGIGALVGMALDWPTAQAKTGTKETYKVVAELPNKVDQTKLIRKIDEEAGVVCWMLQNRRADIYTGLQCMPINNTLLDKENRDAD